MYVVVKMINFSENDVLNIINVELSSSYLQLDAICIYIYVCVTVIYSCLPQL